MMKLNIGASPIWQGDDWYVLDHKVRNNSKYLISGTAENINLKNNSCDVVFCSHVVEHIPHIKLPIVLAEINRIMKKGGILRILTPDLEKICKAYVKKNTKFFNKAKSEDESIRTDLGLGGMLMSFIVTPGQDTVLIDRELKKFIAGYAHLYSYDFKMLSVLLKSLGYSVRKAKFNDCKIAEMKKPLHVVGMKPIWRDLNQKFYKKNGLVHKLINGKYKINFKVTGFDRDPLTSLIIEAKKIKNTSKKMANKKFNMSSKNYNRYAYSLLSHNDFAKNLNKRNIKQI